MRRRRLHFRISPCPGFIHPNKTCGNPGLGVPTVTAVVPSNNRRARRARELALGSLLKKLTTSKQARVRSPLGVLDGALVASASFSDEPKRQRDCWKEPSAKAAVPETPRVGCCCCKMRQANVSPFRRSRGDNNEIDGLLLYHQPTYLVRAAVGRQYTDRWCPPVDSR